MEHDQWYPAEPASESMFGTLTDAELRELIERLTRAVRRIQRHTLYVAAPDFPAGEYGKYLHTWRGIIAIWQEAASEQSGRIYANA
jgi:hypothetical protein